MTLEGSDFTKMTHAEIAAYVAADPEPIPLHLFPLHTEEGRRGFLREFYNVGETAIFAACNHVWNSLGDPVPDRCTAMAVAAGTVGTGKTALRNVLQMFLRQALEIDCPFPPRSDYADLASWNEAALQCFTRDEEDLQALLTAYTAILDGESLAEPSAAEEAVVLQGPWITNGL